MNITMEDLHIETIDQLKEFLNGSKKLNNAFFITWPFKFLLSLLRGHKIVIISKKPKSEE